MPRILPQLLLLLALPLYAIEWQGNVTPWIYLWDDTAGELTITGNGTYRIEWGWSQAGMKYPPIQGTVAGRRVYHFNRPPNATYAWHYARYMRVVRLSGNIEVEYQAVQPLRRPPPPYNLRRVKE